MNKVWNETERNFIRENSALMTDEEGAEKLSQITGRKISIHAWRKQRQKMGIKKLPGRGICEVVKLAKAAKLSYRPLVIPPEESPCETTQSER